MSYRGGMGWCVLAWDRRVHRQSRRRPWHTAPCCYENMPGPQRWLPATLAATRGLVLCGACWPKGLR